MMTDWQSLQLEEYNLNSLRVLDNIYRVATVVPITTIIATIKSSTVITDEVVLSTNVGAKTQDHN